MKKCDYCAKEISYFEQYCDIDCHTKANQFYELREKYEKVFSLVNAICVFGIPIGLFIFTFMNIPGLIVATVSFMVLGIMLILLPFPTDDMISKFKIEKAMKITRYIGAAVILLGIAALVLMLLFIF